LSEEPLLPSLLVLRKQALELLAIPGWISVSLAARS
jgi:hypothetical protein